jgi:hypothetical protein
MNPVSKLKRIGRILITNKLQFLEAHLQRNSRLSVLSLERNSRLSVLSLERFENE